MNTWVITILVTIHNLSQYIPLTVWVEHTQANTHKKHFLTQFSPLPHLSLKDKHFGWIPVTVLPV